MKLEFVPFCSPLDVLFTGVLIFRDFDHNLFCQGQFVSRTASTVDSLCTIFTVLQIYV